ncbi:MAG: protein kinase [Chloroflexi bacterium]|nr:protein kinase [Chloroflexota bacterium]
MVEKIGRYEIKEDLGQRGMAKVYIAYDPNVKRQVALKVMSLSLTEDEEFTARFRREAEAVAALEHVGIVPIYDFGDDQGQLFIVMRLMEGGTLTDRLKDGPLSIEAAASIFRRIAFALDKAHENGIVHRDLKPGNILFDTDGEAYIADFGVAHLSEAGEDLTGTGALIGTPTYMSPEQVRGANDEIDGRSDIYALGVILYEMLSGTIPYEADTPMGTALKHLVDPVPQIRQSTPGLPVEIEQIIAKAMAKERDDRFETAKKMADALDEIVAGSYMPTKTFVESGERAVIDEGIAASTEKRGIKGWLWLVIGVLGIGILAVIFGGNLFGGTTEATSEPPTQTAPAVAVIETEAPTATQMPTTLPEPPTPTPTLEPTAPVLVLPVPISIANVNQISEIIRLGRGTINDVVVGPSRDVFAVAGGLGVWFYDLDTFEGRFSYESEGEGRSSYDSEGLEITSVAWSPDIENNVIAMGGVDGSIQFWNPMTGQVFLTIDAHEESVNDLAWSPDGTMLASGSDDNIVRLWNPITGQLIADLEGHPDNVNTLSWSPNGTYLASAGWTVIVWNIENRRFANNFGGHTNQINSLAWSPDETIIVSASSDGTMRFWDLAANSLIMPLEGQTEPIFASAWSPNGELIAHSNSSEIYVRDAETGQVQQIIEGHTGLVTHLSWVEGGEALLSASNNGEIIKWLSSSWEVRQSNVLHTNQKTFAAFSPDGSQVVSANIEGTIKLWDLASGEQTEGFSAHEGKINGVTWSPDGSRFATAGDDGFARIWDAANLNQIRILIGHSDVINSIAWSPDGQFLATGSDDTSVKIWDAESGAEINSIGQAETVFSVVWSPDSTLVAFASGEHVWIRRASDGQISFKLEGHRAQVNSVAWSPDGELIISGSDDQELRVWRANTGGVELAPLIGHRGSIRSVAWSSDGRLLYSADSEGIIRIWDAETGTELHLLIGHNSQINFLGLFEDLYVLSASADGSIRIWAIPNSQ